MAVVNLSIFGGTGWQFLDDNGDPLSGGKIYTYEAGTTTPKATYTSITGDTAHSNPIVLDAAGRVPGYEIWLLTSSQYKFVLKTASDVTVFTIDNVISNGFGASSIDNFTGDGAEDEYTLTTAPSSEENTMVYINGVYQQKDSYSLAGDVLTFSEAPPYNSSIEVNYY